MIGGEFFVHPYSRSTDSGYGITFRDYVAVEAMKSFILTNKFFIDENGYSPAEEWVAEEAYKQADMMINQRLKEH